MIKYSKCQALKEQEDSSNLISFLSNFQTLRNEAVKIT